MKVRFDFVTNSSSSSFVIAKRNDATRDEIGKLISEIVDLPEFVEEYGEFLYPEIDNVPEALERIVNMIFENCDSGMKLDSWSVCPIEGNSESEDALEVLLYTELCCDTEKFKVTGNY